MIFNRYFYTLIWLYRYLNKSLNVSSFFSNTKVFDEPLHKYIKSNDIIFDIGSHAGTWSFEFAKFNQKGKVFCFDSFPQYAYALKYLTKIFFKTNIEVFNLAISNEEKIINFQWKDEKGNRLTGSSFINKEKTINKKHNIKVQATSIDSICKKILKPDDVLRVIKMDIEGGEYDALLGAKDTLKNRKPMLILELYKLNSVKKINPINKIIILLNKYGYVPLAGHSSENKYIVFRNKPSLLNIKFEGDLILVHKSLDIKKILI